MKKYIYTLLVLILVYGCQNKVSLKLFDISNLETGFKSLKEQGFSKMEDVDLLIMKKRNKDTIVQLEINSNLDNIYSKSWKILIANPDRKKNEEFFLKKGYLLSDFNKFSYDENSYSFICKKEFDDKVFNCKVLNENNQYYLYITYINE